MTTERDSQGGFPDMQPTDHAPPGLDRFVAAMRRLHDLTVSTKPDATTWATAAQHLEQACAMLDGHQVPEGLVPAGRVLGLPGLGHPLLPPWTMTQSGADGVRMEGHFTRAHVGGNNAVSTAGIRPTRTAYLHVDYRSITPIDEPLGAHGRITDIDGRKVFISATMTAADGTLLTEADGLMVRLLPHQP
ncbi:MAG: hypothetical protein QOC58_1116 [Mycobacterium sp.]|jgi:hypothetical protein|nr:hypothetical protein [Mycobacterium sp.]